MSDNASKPIFGVQHQALQSARVRRWSPGSLLGLLRIVGRRLWSHLWLMLAIYGLHFWLQRSLLKLDSRQTSVESLTTGLPNLASAGLPLLGTRLRGTSGRIATRVPGQTGWASPAERRGGGIRRRRHIAR